jgi:hypothetical protein
MYIIIKINTIKVLNSESIVIIRIKGETMGEGLLYDTGFTYRFDRLKPGASKFRGPLAKVYAFFNTVIDVHPRKV